MVVGIRQTHGKASGEIENFEYEFNRKYSPAEAWDQLESNFLELAQGSRTIREYEEESTDSRSMWGKILRMKQCWYVGSSRVLGSNLVPTALYVPSVPSRIWLKGWLGSTIARENRVKSHTNQSSGSKSSDRKRKRDKVDEGNNSSGSRSECSQCGRRHGRVLERNGRLHQVW